MTSAALSPSALIAKRAFWCVLLLFVLATAVLWQIDLHLRNDIAPYGIVSYEFCGLSQACLDTLNAWDQRAQGYALLGLGFDYLYLFLYPGLIAIAIYLLTQANPQQRRLFLFASACCAGTVMADAVENYGLIRMLLDQSDAYGLFALNAAIVKFSLLAASLALLAVALITKLRHLWVHRQAIQS